MKRLTIMGLLAPVAAALVFSTGAAPDPRPVMGDRSVDTTQCAKAPKDRTGGWFCVDQAASKKAAMAVLNSRLDTAVIAAGDGVDGWCYISGCWYLRDLQNRPRTPYRMSIETAVGSYGVLGHVLGTVNVSITDQYLLPNQLKVTTQRMISTRGVRSAYWADYDYKVDATYPYGTPCGKSYTMANVSVGPGLGINFSPVTFTPDACRAPVQAIFHRIYWRDTDPTRNPGRWYLYLKSARFEYKVGVQGNFLGTADTPSGPKSPGGAGWENV